MTFVLIGYIIISFLWLYPHIYLMFLAVKKTVFSGYSHFMFCIDYRETKAWKTPKFCSQKQWPWPLCKEIQKARSSATGELHRADQCCWGSVRIVQYRWALTLKTRYSQTVSLQVSRQVFFLHFYYERMRVNENLQAEI